MVTSSGAWRLEQKRNCETCIVSVNWALAPPATFERVFRENYEVIADAVTTAEGPGYVVLAFKAARELVTKRALQTDSVWSGSDVTIIGRHEQCPVLLENDFGVALRHLLVRTSIVAERPLVRILDLKTGQGFNAEGAGLVEAVTADGPLYVTLGEFGIVMMPVSREREEWPSDPAEGWQRLPERRVVDTRKPHLVHPAGPRAQLLEGRRQESSQEISRVTVVHSLSEPRRVHRNQPLPPDAYAMLKVEGPYETARYVVTQADLELGVLLGRYGRCDIAVDAMPSPDMVSRVHAVLLKEGEVVSVIDTASTNGTAVDGVHVLSGVLGEEAVLELGVGNELLWRLINVQEAPDANA